MDAAKRELKEEVNIDAQTLTEMGDYSSDRNYQRNIVKCFYLAANSTSIQIDNFEIAESSWFEPSAMPENRSSAVTQIMEVYDKFKVKP